MTLNKVAVDLGRVTASELVGNARVLSHTVEQGRVGGMYAYIEALGFEVLYPVTTARTGRALPNINGWVEMILPRVRGKTMA